jgi:asparagine synthase (glutamine-hydrolysing)
MCGIAGALSSRGGDVEKLAVDVSTMITTLRHRGPDDEGVWTDADVPVVLGHRRLAIIELSSDGHQPMLSACGRYVISFNGEIYNYLELQEELRAHGHRFRGGADTEVLLAAVAQWGCAAALERLVGMFALALWDRGERKLWLVRDRAGKKPLYYTRTPQTFYFASELKALKRLPTVLLSLREESLYHYLSLGYVPSPHTIYAEVEEVPAGHALVVDTARRESVMRYWSLPPADSRPPAEREIVDEVDRRLTDAVRLRLRADVPVGAFLSGGIDSGLVTALAARNSSRPVKTFTVGFDDGGFDERPLAAAVAHRYGTEHHEILLSSKLDELLPLVVESYDEPFADPSAVPTFAVARAASQHVKVVLNGEGSDELFGGYRRHLAVRYSAAAARLSCFVPGAVWQGLVRGLPLPREARSPYAFAHRFLRGIGTDPFQRYLVWSSDGFDEADKHALLNGAVARWQPTPEFLAGKFAWLDGVDPLAHFMALDFVLGMSDCLLVKMDIATMAHSLEARCPFLDHRLVEWVARLPGRSRLGGHTTKPLLRELAKRYLPPAVVTAPKRGFEIPLARWMRDELYELTRDVCLDPRGIVLGVCRRRAVEDVLERRTGIDEHRWAKQMWILLMLGLWQARER